MQAVQNASLKAQRKLLTFIKTINKSCCCIAKKKQRNTNKNVRKMENAAED